MNNDETNVTDAQGDGTTRKIMVQIVVMFRASSDADALAVKTAISDVTKDRKGVGIQLHLHDTPGM